MSMRAARYRSSLRGLYLITPDDNDTHRLLDRVRGVLGHAALLQYRNKIADAELRRTQVTALLPLCDSAGVPLIVNDDWSLCRDCGAGGVHLGEHDGDIDVARAPLGSDALIGVSCYDDPQRARHAVASGADYVAFGAFFPSPSKPKARRAALDLLRTAKPLGKPLVAIGGITPDNAPALLAAGADMVAVISGVFDAPDPIAAARAYAACFD